MKTTIDIPEPLYQSAKILAVRRGITLRQTVLEALDQFLNKPTEEAYESRPLTFGERRRLRPEFQRLQESGELSGGTDSTLIISEDRDSREDALF